ncbi:MULTISPECIES: class I SAM-dependent methyltransferase [Brucella]|uniref:Class I SAM-dependent rRNA methyltransferase n=1 Tax=Brucella pseudogrignonensis TaxID=419475 RepID=A0A256GLZ4_9HYPH|nr:class I SAM-dependent methyltransferase [Brucella pseudogrignonensis]EMG55428.1 SAM dependent methyltransferase [Ochrobactrum sp. CDB2]MQP39715.1 class I SAM-dependent rRNA methyltransferase [Ochrobactrum sp. MYb237]NNV21259.1 class I SAM-dependent rRNA methyltransferase [Brucella pseudogrignonensis]OYR28008.1 SAM dependent methyltransferase domain protein [Brucella pseudogrignonensis]PQZ42536.1 class I SAM-dependent rRNA methyltransferase [Brucella pseudogrignonensis]
MKAPKGKGKKPTGGKEQRGFGRAKHDEPRSAAKHESKPDNKASFFKKPRPQFAKATPKPAEEKHIAAPQREIKAYQGERPGERAPVILETEPSDDYALLDSGDGLKLEQYGPYRIVRPEGQAIWLPSLPKSEWDKADAVFTGNTDEEGMGRWAFPKLPLGDTLGETWPMRHDGISFHGRFTSFRHVGVFPEQAAHWSYMDNLIRDAAKSGRTVKVLNLFGYTGVASLVAARAGAEVTHVDASKKAIVWARENQEMADLSDKPIRWICEDAMKFVQREERRGSFYDIILLDPPAYGRGPNGEVWQLFEHLPAMVDTCRSILTPNALAVILTAYSIRASFFAIHELVRDRFTGLGGTVESGELILRERASQRALSTSMFSRWVAK